MKRSIVPGTFDPVTCGHIDIVERAASVFDEVVIGVALSPEKGGGPLFTVEERVALLEEAVKHIPHVSVVPFDSLLVDFARQVGATAIVKGLRAVTDFEREFQMAMLNWRLDSSIETMFITSIPEYMFLSSSAVKEIAQHGGAVRGLVPENVREALARKLQIAP